MTSIVLSVVFGLFAIAIVYFCWRLIRMGISDALGRFYSDIESEVDQKMEDAINKRVSSLNATIAGLEEQVATSTSRVAIKIGDTEHVVEGQRHYQLERLILLAANKLSVMLVGMAGSGKTHAAQQVAEALGREFYAMSVGAQTSKSDILGYMHAGGDYVDTMFRRAYEHGGIFLMDEIDAGNANVLIQINAAIANEYCAFPDQMVKRHDDFVFVGSANTYGTGANRQYVGRNQLDAATLDRFTILEWNIDEKLEMAFAGTSKEAMKWCRAMRELRSWVDEEGMRVLVTPRATQRGAQMLAADVPLDDVMDMAIVGMFPKDKKSTVRQRIKDSMGKPMNFDKKKGKSAPGSFVDTAAAIDLVAARTATAAKYRV